MNRLVIILFLTTSFAFSQEIKYHNPYLDFEIDGIYYLFGHEVAFRTEPDKKSQVIDILKIGDEIIVLEKSEKSVDYYGIESFYYKVNYNKKIGYILGSLISLEKKEIYNSKYFFTYGKDEEKFYLIIRHLNEQLIIKEIVAELATIEFSIDIYKGKGIKEIDNIIFINYLAEACGVDGGGIYFFQTGNELKKVFEIIQVTDAGVYWIFENLIFPTDEKGVKGKIVYEKEIGDYKDEETNWIEISKVSRELEWKNGEILPKLDPEK